MNRGRGSEVWQVATITALGSASLLAVAYVLSVWHPLSSRRRAPLGASALFEPHVPLTTAAPAPARGPAPADSFSLVTNKQGLPSAAAAAPSARPQAQAQAPALDDFTREALAAGAPVDAAGLKQNGRIDLFHALVARVAQHPRVVKFLLNNDTLNAAVFATALSGKRCQDKAAFEAYLSNPNPRDPMGIVGTMATFDALLSNPQSAHEAIGSKFVDRVLSCPGLRGVGRDPSALTTIAAANPKLQSYFTNPAALEAIGSSQKAQEISMQVETFLQSGQFGTSLTAVMPGQQASIH